MRLGFDVDGVLCDFNTAFILKVVKETGRDLFPPRPFDIPCWAYPQYYGYTEAEETAIWNRIEKDSTFWFNLPTYADTTKSLGAINDRMRWGDDVYFITSRPGYTAKVQTEQWLSRWMPGALLRQNTVLISGHKGLCARALNLDAYIDDRDRNALDVATTSTRTFLLDRPWNRELDEKAHGIERVTSVEEMLGRL